MNLFKNNINKILLITVALGFLFLQESLRFTNVEDAVSNGLNTAALSQTSWMNQKRHQGEPFGGYILTRIECDCEGNYIVLINDYVSRSNLWLKVEKGKSTIYEYGKELTPNKYTLGTYDKGATCKMQVRDCKPAKVDGVINSGPGAGVSK
ncbi:MAG: hypothetical protein WC087_02030 [Candidatus Paceibacterota bacterium]